MNSHFNIAKSQEPPGIPCKVKQYVQNTKEMLVKSWDIVLHICNSGQTRFIVR